MDPQPCILVVDDEVGIRRLCSDVLRRSGFEVEVAPEAGAALRRLEAGLAGHARAIDLVLTDIRMTPMDGLRFLTAIRDLSPGLRVVLMTGYPTMESAVEGMRLGALDYVTKPFTPSELRAVVKKAMEGFEPASPVIAAASASEDDGEVAHLGQMVACSGVMKALFRTLTRVAATDAGVLVTGESGTGKELVARAIHAQSRRRAGPFVPVNCSALVGALMESELFGHEKGAFTGAGTDKTGLFQAADGGTLFLDEIGDLSLALQPKLLRALQEGEVKPVGRVAPVPVDVRIVAATHRDLEREVAEGRFREDLYYRLNVFRLTIAPLRARREDIAPIARAHLSAMGERMGVSKPLSLGDGVLRALVSHDWPGNVRELHNVLLRAATMADGPALEAGSLSLSPASVAPVGGYVYEGLPLDEVERRHILHMLEKHGGNRSRTAQALGINRTTLWKKLRRYGLDDD